MNSYHTFNDASVVGYCRGQTRTPKIQVSGSRPRFMSCYVQTSVTTSEDSLYIRSVVKQSRYRDWLTRRQMLTFESHKVFFFGSSSENSGSLLVSPCFGLQEPGRNRLSQTLYSWVLPIDLTRSSSAKIYLHLIHRLILKMHAEKFWTSFTMVSRCFCTLNSYKIWLLSFNVHNLKLW